MTPDQKSLLRATQTTWPKLNLCQFTILETYTHISTFLEHFPLLALTEGKESQGIDKLPENSIC